MMCSIVWSVSKENSGPEQLEHHRQSDYPTITINPTIRRQAFVSRKDSSDVIRHYNSVLSFWVHTTTCEYQVQTERQTYVVHDRKWTYLVSSDLNGRGLPATCMRTLRKEPFGSWSQTLTTNLQTGNSQPSYHHRHQVGQALSPDLATTTTTNTLLSIH